MIRLYNITLDEIYARGCPVCDGYDELYEIIDQIDDASDSRRGFLESKVLRMRSKQTDMSIRLYTYEAWIPKIFLHSLTEYFKKHISNEMTFLAYIYNLFLNANLQKRIDEDEYASITAKQEGFDCVNNMLSS